VASIVPPVVAKLTLKQKQELIDYLSQFVTPERQAKIERVLSQRTRYLTVMVEDFYLSQNASAVLRTSEGLGIQDIHIVENEHSFKLNRDVTRGSNKWLTLYQYNEEGRNNTADCFESLRQRGYKLAATCLHEGAITPEQLPLDKPIALLMGSEHEGLSDYALEYADYAVKIPMDGFLESFNVSVSAAVCLYILTHRLKQQDLPWRLSNAEKAHLRLDWLTMSSRSSEALIEQFLNGKSWKK
jgi:tRNA (guanosine-2'-O-)-methyltransferase